MEALALLTTARVASALVSIFERLVRSEDWQKSPGAGSKDFSVLRFRPRGLSSKWRAS